MPVLSTLGAAIANVYGFTSGLIKDQYFNLVSLLLPGNGTNGAQNNTFLDSGTANSGSGFTITRNGNTTQGTFSPFSQTGWSNYFGSSTANIIFASDASFGVGTGNFSVELSVNFNAWTGNQVLFLTGTSVASGITLDKPSSGNTLRFADPNGIIISYSWTPNIGQWYNIAVVRAGTGTNQTTLYIDGTAVATGTSSASIPAYTAMVGGINYASPYNTQGYISNLRFSNVARTISNPTSFFTSDANTLLLTCRSNRFVDISGTPKTISQINGTTSVTPFSPFAPTSSYSAAAVGGSGYFDGSGDFLTTPNVTALNLYNTTNTVECWIYPLSLATNLQIYGTDFDSTYYTIWFINSTTGYPAYQSRNGTVITASSGITLNQWNHVVWGRSGTTMSIWINGTRFANGTISVEDQWGTGLITIGRFNGADRMNGYLSGLRVVKGTDVYGVSNTSITVPTSPSTAITNTSLLLNFTNAGVVDATAKNVLETVGNAQISTAQSKWGGGSMYFDGTDDRLSNNNAANPLYAFRTGDFTIEAWVYPLVNTGERGWIQTSDTAGGLKTTYATGIVVIYGASPNFYWSVNVGGTTISTTTSVVTNAWTHIAVTRASGSVRVYINGTLAAGPTSATGDLTGQYICVGGYYSTTYLWNGYVDDLRVTNYARYTGASLTVPSAPFPLQ